jgi:hypothetical protein
MSQRLASLYSQALTSNIPPDVGTVEVEVAKLQVDLSKAFNDTTTAELEREIAYRQDLENEVFAEAEAFAKELTKSMKDGGFAGLIHKQLPEPKTPTFVPPIMEKSKRPVNIPKQQKDVLLKCVLLMSFKWAAFLIVLYFRWLKEHLQNPYPTDADRAELSAKTGMQIRQINTWFQNARTRMLPKLRSGESDESDEQDDEEERVPTKKRKVN